MPAIALSLFCFLLFVSSQATALPIQFDFRSNTIEEIDEASSLSINKNNLTIFLSTDDGVLNRTASAFGINANGSGDDSDEIDSGSSVSEILRISFSNTVYLLGLVISKLGVTDSGKLLDGVDTLLLFSNSGAHSLNNYLLSANEELILAYVSGNGFSFDSITVDTVSVAEPSSWLMFMIGLVGLFIKKNALLNRAR